ncbi:3-oxoacyl-[acyl-carrier protein] reductase [Lachnospiraceae bacterium KM106-2]|nr:3-oxoacyl-[acyl-carrier protein] reductase [Lachnospiraceae bacterium KM106-2]
MIEDKNAIVTGSNRGIGKAIVEKLASEHYNIWACARAYNEKFEKELEELATEYQVWIKPIYFDLADSEQLKAGFKQIYKERKTIDLLVNNAGMGHSEIFMRTPMSKIEEIYRVNTFSVMELTQLVLRVMTRQKSGNIVNIASMAGLDSQNVIAYGSSKAAIISFTKALAVELGFIEPGIRVNAVAPGYIDTDMANRHGQDGKFEECALKRMGQPEEIANIVNFLASDESSYINGEVIRADGAIIFYK